MQFGLNATVLSTEEVEKNPRLWTNVRRGEYRLVFATPEILLSPTGYFMKKMLHERDSPFLQRLITCAIDECHVLDRWGRFRPYYQKLPNLRDCLYWVPFLGLTATMQLHCIGEFERSVSFKNMAVVRTQVKNETQSLWRIPLNNNNGLEDLSILIPPEATMPEEIPQTYVFVPTCILANEAAQYLRRLLHVSLRRLGDKIIRAYSSPLDDHSKQQTMDGIYDETVRIVCTTDALGLGMNKSRIPRVVQFRVDSRVDVEALSQRFGRGGRGSEEPYLCLLFASMAQLTPDPDSEFTLAISADNRQQISQLRPVLEARPSERHCTARTTASNLPPAVQLVLHTTGCLNNAMCLPFEETQNLLVNGDRQCQCQNCLMGFMDSDIDPPSLHKVSFKYTQAWLETHTPKATCERVRKGRAKWTLTEERVDKIMARISQWVETLRDSCGYRLLSGRMLLPVKTIAEIRKKLNRLHSIEDLGHVLQSCGHSMEEGILKGRVEDLYRCIDNAIKETQPPSQLRECLAWAGYLEAVSVNRRAIPLPIYMTPTPVTSISHPSSASSLSHVPSWPIFAVPTRRPLAEITATSKSSTNLSNMFAGAAVASAGEDGKGRVDVGRSKRKREVMVKGNATKKGRPGSNAK